MSYASIKKPFSAHLTELRLRTFVSVVILLIGTGIGYFFYPTLLTFALRPLGQTIYYSSPTGGFQFVFMLCLFFGFLFALPVITYNLLRFIEPVFPKRISVQISIILVSSIFLMLLGMSIAYFINIPTALHFFGQFSSKQLHPLISTDSYLSFILTDMVGFGIVFQMPLMFLFINYFHRIEITWLLHQEKYIIVLGFLLGAIFTPDPFNQVIMALPVIVLYQITILIIFLTNKNQAKRS